ncbi:MAG: LPS export ABC transporter periplasmic protein LptC [Succinivibrionaceae bacterium]
MIKNIFFLILLILSYMLYKWVSTNVADYIYDEIEAKPSLITYQSSSKLYNSLGILHTIIKADYAEYYKSINQTNLTSPYITYYPHKYKLTENLKTLSEEKWYLNANYGIIVGDYNITLKNNVVAKNSEPTQMVQEILSEYLEMDLTSKEIRTPEKVLIKGNNFTNEGKGLQGNMETKLYSLKEDCHAYYNNSLSDN